MSSSQRLLSSSVRLKRAYRRPYYHDTTLALSCTSSSRSLIPASSVLQNFFPQTGNPPQGGSSSFSLSHKDRSFSTTALVQASRMSREIHSSAARPTPVVGGGGIMAPPSAFPGTTPVVDPHHPQHPPSPSSMAPLSVLPIKAIVRSLLVNTISSSPLLLPPSLRIMSILAHTQNQLLNPDSNPLLRFFIKKTFYAQFCAGEAHREVKNTISGLKNIGFDGVVLGYAKEVVLKESEVQGLSDAKAEKDALVNEVLPWAEGTMETVRLAEPGDFVALKFTGAGRQALSTLADKAPPPPGLADAIDSICKLAVSRGVRLLFDAEQAAIQPGIDQWTLHYMRKYNTDPGRAIVYGTYQAYLKSAASTLKAHLEEAKAGGFTLGVKLVRGAYLGSDPRHLFHDTKEATDATYDTLAKNVLTREWSDMMPGSGTFPAASLVLATHNAKSVRLARDICESGAAKSEIAFAQLQGMADEVSCELVAGKQARGSHQKTLAADTGKIRTYKYLVWGSTGECMKYLLRRAYENRDAVQRTKTGRDAMLQEAVRRVKTACGFA